MSATLTVLSSTLLGMTLWAAHVTTVIRTEWIIAASIILGSTSTMGVSWLLVDWIMA